MVWLFYFGESMKTYNKESEKIWYCLFHNIVIGNWHGKNESGKKGIGKIKEMFYHMWR